MQETDYGLERQSVKPNMRQRDIRRAGESMSQVICLFEHGGLPQMKQLHFPN